MMATRPKPAGPSKRAARILCTTLNARLMVLLLSNAPLERITLPSGLKAAFLPKKTRGESVTLRLTLRYGSEGSLTNKAKGAEMLPKLMGRGTKKLSRQELTDALDKNRAALT